MTFKTNLQASQLPAPSLAEQERDIRTVVPYQSSDDRSIDDSTSMTSLSIQQPMRRFRLRTVFSAEQLDLMENEFKKYPYPDAFQRETIARNIGLTETRVQIWFQNRRAKWRRQEVPRRDKAIAVHRCSNLICAQNSCTCTSSTFAYDLQSNSKTSLIQDNRLTTTLPCHVISGHSPVIPIPFRFPYTPSLSSCFCCPVFTVFGETSQMWVADIPPNKHHWSHALKQLADK